MPAPQKFSMKLADWHRLSEDKSLNEVTANAAKKFAFGFDLGTFGDDLHIHLVRQSDRRGDDHLVLFVCKDLRDQATVEFYLSCRKPFEMAYGRIACAIIVDGYAYSKCSKPMKFVDLRFADDVSLRDLKNEAGRWEMILAKGIFDHSQDDAGAKHGRSKVDRDVEIGIGNREVF